MPEYAEIRLMSDFINQCSDILFTDVYNNPSCKQVQLGKTYDNSLPLVFNVKSDSRGKELKVSFSCWDVYFSMGMTGNWMWLPKKDGQPSDYNQIKVAFISDVGYLCLVDVRNFAKWRFDSKWSTKRGPDPLKDFENFKKNIYSNWHKEWSYKPIYECLMNQQYFSGIGNYLRAEIIGRLDIDPSVSLRYLYLKNPDKCQELLDSIPIIINLFYDKLNIIKGYRTYLHGSNKLQFYGNVNDCDSLVDSNKRRFWYHKKWKL